MDTSDFIAVAALIVSFMALFVSFTTKFSEFADANWGNVGLFTVGVFLVLLFLFFLYVWAFYPPTPEQQTDAILSTLSAPLIGFSLIIIAIVRERRRNK